VEEAFEKIALETGFVVNGTEWNRKFGQLLEWSNNGIKKEMRSYGLFMPRCVFLNAIRNAYSHELAKDNPKTLELRRKLLECCPTRVELVWELLKKDARIKDLPFS